MAPIDREVEWKNLHQARQHKWVAGRDAQIRHRLIEHLWGAVRGGALKQANG